MQYASRFFWLIALFVVINIATGTCNAASPYRLSLAQEVAYLTTGATLSTIGLITDERRNALDPEQIAGLKRNDIPSFDRYVAGRWNPTAQRISDGILAVGLASPLPLIISNHDDWRTLSFMTIETFALSGGTMLFAKGTVTRMRPYTYGDAAPEDKKLDLDAQRSFFSGHAAIISSGLFFSANVFSDYYPSSVYKPYVWSAAVAGSLLGAWARVEGGMHFPSDVTIGLLVGATIGFAIPYTHHRSNTLTIIPYAEKNNTGIYLFKSF